MADGNSAHNRDATILQVQSLQETVKGLILRLQSIKSQYEAGLAENDMLSKYIHNLKSNSLRSGKIIH